MRVVSGTLGGRRLAAPSGRDTRPTSDRVREGLFSRLEAVADGGVQGRRVLDLFAGSGALGIEAISRGSDHATFVERDPRAVSVVRRNIQELSIEGHTSVLRGDAFKLVERGALLDGPFSLLFLDPPYRINKSVVRGAIEALANQGLLEADTLVVWEHASGGSAEWPEGFLSLGERTYGDTVVDIARSGGGSTG